MRWKMVISSNKALNQLGTLLGDVVPAIGHSTQIWVEWTYSIIVVLDCVNDWGRMAKDMPLYMFKPLVIVIHST
jgi:hypothetical protein